MDAWVKAAKPYVGDLLIRQQVHRAWRSSSDISSSALVLINR